MLQKWERREQRWLNAEIVSFKTTREGKPVTRFRWRWSAFGLYVSKDSWASYDEAMSAAKNDPEFRETN